MEALTMLTTRYGAGRVEISKYEMQSAISKMQTGDEMTNNEACMRGYVLMFAAVNKRPFDPECDMPKSLTVLVSNKSLSFDADGLRLPYNQRVIDAYMKERR
jgi:hypothetical protein